MKKFPKNFLWGGALSNVQAEGAYLTDGKGLNVYDTLKVKKEIGQADINGTDLASNHYYQFEEDIKLMKEMSFRAYRFSIVWSRIHPKGIEKEPNELGLAYYEKIIDRLLEEGIEPVVSLVHFDMPDYLAKTYNGFFSREVVDFYANHVEAVVERFKNKVKYWITYNEMNTAPLYAELVAGAVLPDGLRREEFYKILVHHTQLAHAKALLIIKSKDPKAKVSGMINFYQVYPKTSHPKDVQAASVINNYHSYLTFDVMTQGTYPSYFKAYLKNRGLEINDEEGLKIIKKASKKIDFLSISYYTTCEVTGPDIEDALEFENEVIFNPKLQNSEFLEVTDWGWTINSKGFRTALATLNQRYNKPIFVVENGIACSEELDSNCFIEDDKRIKFYSEHIKSMREAMEIDGVDIIGYLAWAPIDFLSSHKEMRKRYGFIYVDSENVIDNKLKRIPKKSFYWYKKMIESDGASIDD